MMQKRLLPLLIAMAASGSIPAISHAQNADDDTDEQRPGPVVLEEVVVQGVRQAELNAREAERDKKAFSSIIAQDDAGNFADQNVAESLQRLPGITLQKSEGEGRFVSIRGLGPDFVTVNMNGSEMASAAEDVQNREGRGFSLDAISADLLGGIEVYKTLLPSMDLNSIGGTVNVKTVSAFDRNRDSLRLSVQTYYQDYASELSPRLTLQGTNLLSDDRVGVAYSVAWEKRDSHSYEVLHHPDEAPRSVARSLPSLPAQAGDPSLTIPFETQKRQEVAEREKLGATFSLEFRPNEASEYRINTSYTSLQDLDLAWREYFRYGQAGEGDIAFVNPATNTFGVVDADVQQQMFIQDGESETSAIAFIGKNIIESDSGNWTIDYEINSSKSVFDKPDGRRVQFRVRDVPLIGRASKEYIAGAVVSPQEMAALAGVAVSDFAPASIAGYGSGLDASRFKFDNLFIENSSREDTIDQIKGDLTKEFEEGLFTYVKVGFASKARERVRDQNRWSLTPSSFNADCGDSLECSRFVLTGDLSNFAYEPVDHPSFEFPAITYDAAEYLIRTTRVIAKPENQDVLQSDFRDYVVTEDTLAAYIETEIAWNEVHSLIFGVRWDKTEFSSSGVFAISNDNFELGGVSSEAISFDYSFPLADAGAEYDNLFPSVHYRLDLEEIVVRTSLWTSFVRPTFGDSKASATIGSNFSLCNPETGICARTPADTVPLGTEAPTVDELRFFTLAPGNSIEFGNPTLEAMTSVNFDASIGWYAGDNLFLQAAFFYKDIDNFIADVSDAPLTIGQLPLQLPVDQITDFIIPTDVPMSVDINVNGDKAKVYGVELSYTQNFDNGLLIQSNLTVMDSTAKLDTSFGGGETQLPDQADSTGNLVLGWENNDFSARVSANYRSKVLEKIGNERWLDVYHDDTLSVDFKTTYQLNDDIKIYFDALNLTDDYAIRYFEGDSSTGGKMMYRSELFGRSVQLGLNYRFM